MNYLHWIILGLYLWAGLTNIVWYYEGNKGYLGVTRSGRFLEFIIFVIAWPLTPLAWFFEDF
jgi:hypothetical protein